jgi:putative FmdB family regulatory protein
MPFYEYQCKNCGHTLEAMQKITDGPLKKCPHCGKSQLQKLMSAPVFRLKGGGWYETDFKSDQDNKRNLADRPDAEAPKDDKKDKAETTTGKDAAVSADAAKPEKSADKAPDKAAGSGKKPAPAAAAAASLSRRGAGSTAAKSKASKVVKRPARPARPAPKRLARARPKP